MKKAVLFDFWGTLVENGVYSPLKQTQKLLAPRMHFSEYVVIFEKAFMTKEFDDLTKAFQEVGKAFGKQINQEAVDKLIGIWNSNRLLAKPYEETLQVLANLKQKGMKIALVSNTYKDCVESVLEKYDMTKYFDAIMLSCKLGMLKTDTKLFDQTIEKLGVTKEEAIMIGDSIPTDIAGAQNAGIKAVLIDRKGRRDYAEKIKYLTELNEYLE